MKKQFANKEAFEKWLEDVFSKDAFEMAYVSDEEIIEKLLECGYTDLDDLLADGHAYQIGGHGNNGWMYEDEVDWQYIDKSELKAELRKR